MHRIVLFRLSGNYIPLYQPTLSGITLLVNEMAMVMVWWYGSGMTWHGEVHIHVQQSAEREGMILSRM